MSDLKVPDFTAAEFIDGRNERTDAHREEHCRHSGCPSKNGDKCEKHSCLIKDADCDPMAEYMRRENL